MQVRNKVQHMPKLLQPFLTRLDDSEETVISQPAKQLLWQPKYTSPPIKEQTELQLADILSQI